MLTTWKDLEINLPAIRRSENESPFYEQLWYSFYSYLTLSPKWVTLGKDEKETILKINRFWVFQLGFFNFERLQEKTKQTLDVIQLITDIILYIINLP